MTLRWRLVSLQGEEIPEGMLSGRERAALEGLALPRRRRKWLAGRIAAKYLLAGELGATAPALDRISILNDPSGAPYAEIDGTRWPGSLSISHRGCHGLAALDTDPRASVGADLETVEARDPALVRQFFTSAEADRVEGTRAETRWRTVARIWSAKEAVLKALGVGLRMDTREIEIGEPETAAGEDGWWAVPVALRGEARVAAAGRPLEVRRRDLEGGVITVARLAPPG